MFPDGCAMPRLTWNLRKSPYFKMSDWPRWQIAGRLGLIVEHRKAAMKNAQRIFGPTIASVIALTMIAEGFL